MSAPRALWSVWDSGWEPVYTSEAAGVVGQEECRSFLAAQYRQQPGEEAVIVAAGKTWPIRYRLLLKAPVRLGSGLPRKDADVLAARHAPNARAVRTGSPEDVEFTRARLSALAKRD